MRILHVIPFLWSGAGNVVTRLCAAQAAGNDVGIITSGRSKGFTDWAEYRKRMKRSGVEHFEIDFFDRDPAIFWHSVKAFAKLTNEWQPNVVHTHSGVPACAAALCGLRFIGQIHSWGVGRPEWMNAMDLMAFRSAHRVLCGSIAYQKVLINGGVDPARIRYLPWGLDLKEIRKRSGLRTPSISSFRIGFLGRVEPRKGQLEAVHAFHKFHRRHFQSRLEFVGPIADEKYREEISRFVIKTGLIGSVKFCGHVSNPYAKVKTWSLFMSLSSDEGQGIAILEAMALGIPVLTRRVAGVEDYLHDGETGLSVASSSPVDVADRMEWALHHEQDLARMAACAKKMVEAEYNWNSMLEKMNSLYEIVTNSSSRTYSRLGQDIERSASLG